MSTTSATHAARASSVSTPSHAESPSTSEFGTGAQARCQAGRASAPRTLRCGRPSPPLRCRGANTPPKRHAREPVRGERREREYGKAIPSACACERHRLPHRSPHGRIPARDIGGVDAADEPRAAGHLAASRRAAQREPSLRSSWAAGFSPRSRATTAYPFLATATRWPAFPSKSLSGRSLRGLRISERMRWSMSGRMRKSLRRRPGSRRAGLTAPLRRAASAWAWRGRVASTRRTTARPHRAKWGSTASRRRTRPDQSSLGRVAPALGEAEARADVDFVGVVARPASLAVRGGRHFGAI